MVETAKTDAPKSYAAVTELVRNYRTKYVEKLDEPAKTFANQVVLSFKKLKYYNSSWSMRTSNSSGRPFPRSPKTNEWRSWALFRIGYAPCEWSKKWRFKICSRICSRILMRSCKKVSYGDASINQSNLDIQQGQLYNALPQSARDSIDRVFCTATVLRLVGSSHGSYWWPTSMQNAAIFTQ